MTYDEYMSIVINSKATDWLLFDEWGKITFKKDLAFSIEEVEEDFSERKFEEDWVKKFPNKDAYRKRLLLKYNGNIVEEIFLVGVDGNHSLIPLPKLNEMTINSTQYHIGRIINGIYGKEYEDYLRRCNIRLK